MEEKVKILCHFFKCDFRVRVVAVYPSGRIKYAAEEGARGIMTCRRCGEQKQVVPKGGFYE